MQQRPRERTTAVHLNLTLIVRVLLATLAAAGLFVCYLLIHPFLEIVAWALSFAIVLKPLELRLRKVVRHGGVSSALATALAGALILGAAAFVIYSIASTGAEQIERVSEPGGLWSSKTFAAKFPQLSLVMKWLETHANFQGEIQRRTAEFGQTAATALTGSLTTLLSVFLTLFVLFYFLRDSEKILAAIESSVPLTRRESRAIFCRIHDTVFAVIGGTLVCSAVQGTLGGLIFWGLGLGAPVLWGGVMALMSMIPMLGAFVVWAPAAIYLGISGNWTSALLLAAWGATAIGCIDNFLYPALVGTRLRFHPLLVFFAVLGGVTLYGASGVILGPLTLSVTDGVLFLLRSELQRPSRRTSSLSAVTGGLVNE